MDIITTAIVMSRRGEDEMVEDDYEILEPTSDFSSKGEEVFSQPSIVMMSFRKIVEAGSKEMKEGYWNTKFDRTGNAHRVWIPDSRKEFIECVNTVRMIMIRDIDEEAEKELKEIDKKLKKKYKKFCLLEENDWKNAPSVLKDRWKKEGSYLRKGFLSQSLPYAFEYIEEEVKAAREIVQAISKLLKRGYDYGEIGIAV